MFVISDPTKFGSEIRIFAICGPHDVIIMTHQKFDDTFSSDTYSEQTIIFNILHDWSLRHFSFEGIISHIYRAS